ncbi:MAG: hypothetical protein CMH55_09220 [Myxococcales bacterium]|nr:hypothetical protein [Myxococcales bacterium]|tara:strand:- start:1697 stop:2473 length:777 start_codon:yes stop_codon:yes gene_type:complete
MRRFALTLLLLSGCASAKMLAHQIETEEAYGYSTVVNESVMISGTEAKNRNYQQTVSADFSFSRLRNEKDPIWRLKVARGTLKREDLSPEQIQAFATGIQGLVLTGLISERGRKSGTFVYGRGARSEPAHSARWALRNGMVVVVAPLPGVVTKPNGSWDTQSEVLLGHDLEVEKTMLTRAKVIDVSGSIWTIEYRIEGKVKWETVPGVWLRGDYAANAQLQWNTSSQRTQEINFEAKADLTGSQGSYKLHRKGRTAAR